MFFEWFIRARMVFISWKMRWWKIGFRRRLLRGFAGFRINRWVFGICMMVALNFCQDGRHLSSNPWSPRGQKFSRFSRKAFQLTIKKDLRKMLKNQSVKSKFLFLWPHYQNPPKSRTFPTSKEKKMQKWTLIALPCTCIAYFHLK